MDNRTYFGNIEDGQFNRAVFSTFTNAAGPHRGKWLPGHEHCACPCCTPNAYQTSVVRAGDFPLTRMHGKQIARRGVF
jgi:hypothetical protein